MTTLLRLYGARIMGIHNPPLPTGRPPFMSDTDAAWIRDNAWTKGLRAIEAAYPYGFHHWCSCQQGPCWACETGRHDHCTTADGPRPDRDAGCITDARGFVVARLVHAPDQTPCRQSCPCQHTPGRGPDDRRTGTRRARIAPSPLSPGQQLGLFDTAAAGTAS